MTHVFFDTQYYDTTIKRYYDNLIIFSHWFLWRNKVSSLKKHYISCIAIFLWVYLDLYKSVDKNYQIIVIFFISILGVKITRVTTPLRWKTKNLKYFGGILQMTFLLHGVTLQMYIWNFSVPFFHPKRVQNIAKNRCTWTDNYYISFFLSFHLIPLPQ